MGGGRRGGTRGRCARGLFLWFSIMWGGDWLRIRMGFWNRESHEKIGVSRFRNLMSVFYICKNQSLEIVKVMKK